MKQADNKRVAAVAWTTVLVCSGCLTAAELPEGLDAAADAADAGRSLVAADSATEPDASIPDASADVCVEGAGRPCGDCYVGEQRCARGRWEPCRCVSLVPCEESVYRGELHGTYRVGEGEDEAFVDLQSSEFVLHFVRNPYVEFDDIVIENGCLLAEGAEPGSEGAPRAFVGSIRGQMNCQTGDVSASVSGMHAVEGSAALRFEGPLTGNVTSVETLAGEWVTRDEPADLTDDGQGAWTLTRESVGEPPDAWPTGCAPLSAP